MRLTYSVLVLSFVFGVSSVLAQESADPKKASSDCDSNSVICRKSPFGTLAKFDGKVEFELLTPLAKKTERDGRPPILSVDLNVSNRSEKSFSSKIRHEWFGGVEPLTDLWVKVKRCVDSECSTREGEAYQVGNLDKSHDTFWRPGDSLLFHIRLNWPGTGSVPIEPLIAHDQPGIYKLQFIMFMRIGSEEYFTESKELELNVQ